MYRQLYMGGGIGSLDAGAPSIKYEGDIKPQMASAPDPMADLYDQFLNMKKQGVIPADMDFDSFKDLIREQAAYGGSMRQQYGLGSIVKKAVKGVTKAVKSVASSDLGKAALTGAALYYGGGGNLFGLQRAGMSGFSMANLPGYATLFGSAATGPTAFGSPSARTTGILSKLIPSSFAGKAVLGITALGGFTGYLASQGMDEQQIEEVKSRPEALKTYLRQYYVNLNPEVKNKPELVEKFVNSQLGEYAYATGGRVKYAMGNTAQMAAGIEGLPFRQNQAGVGEVDLRETGGFIPPVGVKEKADDIPAMLSNNEFVFTADAVRGMGEGNVNVGAQRMYDMMKKLEKGGRV
jgi:hypothetical protein